MKVFPFPFPIPEKKNCHYHRKQKVSTKMDLYKQISLKTLISHGFPLNVYLPLNYHSLQTQTPFPLSWHFSTKLSSIVKMVHISLSVYTYLFLSSFFSMKTSMNIKIKILTLNKICMPFLLLICRSYALNLRIKERDFFSLH